MDPFAFVELDAGEISESQQQRLLHFPSDAVFLPTYHAALRRAAPRPRPMSAPPSSCLRGNQNAASKMLLWPTKPASITNPPREKRPPENPSAALPPDADDQPDKGEV